MQVLVPNARTTPIFLLLFFATNESKEQSKTGGLTNTITKLELSCSIIIFV